MEFQNGVVIAIVKFYDTIDITLSIKLLVWTKNMKKISLMMWICVENVYKEITMINFFNHKTWAKKSR
jgi:hypothetical protein